jgi:2-oxoisovalerate dehydrogenase E1 component
MVEDQAARLDRHFIDAVRALKEHEPVSSEPQQVGGDSGLTGSECLELFEAQATSRHLDFAARWLQTQGAGFYTIGSAGHESNAAVAAALRLTDPALLHYRSCAFYVARAAQAAGVTDPVRDVLLGVAAAAAEPISGGRHKVFGHAWLNVIPQTSTIASHLPRAVGTPAIERSRKLDVDWLAR